MLIGTKVKRDKNRLLLLFENTEIWPNRNKADVKGAAPAGKRISLDQPRGINITH